MTPVEEDLRKQPFVTRVSDENGDYTGSHQEENGTRLRVLQHRQINVIADCATPTVLPTKRRPVVTESLVGKKKKRSRVSTTVNNGLVTTVDEHAAEVTQHAMQSYEPIVKKRWTKGEDMELLSHYVKHGNEWSSLVSGTALNGRTHKSIVIHWYRSVRPELESFLRNKYPKAPIVDDSNGRFILGDGDAEAFLEKLHPPKMKALRQPKMKALRQPTRLQEMAETRESACLPESYVSRMTQSGNIVFDKSIGEKKITFQSVDEAILYIEADNQLPEIYKRWSGKTCKYRFLFGKATFLSSEMALIHFSATEKGLSSDYIPYKRTCDNGEDKIVFERSVHRSKYDTFDSLEDALHDDMLRKVPLIERARQQAQEYGYPDNVVPRLIEKDNKIVWDWIVDGDRKRTFSRRSALSKWLDAEKVLRNPSSEKMSIEDVNKKIAELENSDNYHAKHFYKSLLVAIQFYQASGGKIPRRNGDILNEKAVFKWFRALRYDAKGEKLTSAQLDQLTHQFGESWKVPGKYKLGKLQEKKMAELQNQRAIPGYRKKVMERVQAMAKQAAEFKKRNMAERIA